MHYSLLIPHSSFSEALVVPGRLELPTSTLSVWRSNQLSYRTVVQAAGLLDPSFFHSLSIKNRIVSTRSRWITAFHHCFTTSLTNSIINYQLSISVSVEHSLQKGGVPAAPSGTATLLRLSPNHRFHPRPTLALTDFRRPRLSWLDGRCVQGPGTYSPRHG